MGLSLNLKFKTKRYRSVNSGYRAAPDESSGVPMVIQRHILFRCFVAAAQPAVVTKHFLSGVSVF